MATRMLVILIVITLTACSTVNELFLSAEHQITSTETVTYRNERFNYELDYPAGWFVEERAHSEAQTSQP